MKDLEKRLSIIEEKLGINKVNLHVGLKFTYGKGETIYEITSISDRYVKIGWGGVKDRVDYLICTVSTLFNDGDWKVYNYIDKLAELKEAHMNGYVIQFLCGGSWEDMHQPIFWDSPIHRYRIKPTQQSSLEQDIQQLKDKYKQYKFTITIEDNI